MVIASCVILIAANIISAANMRRRNKAYDEILKGLEELERELDEQDRIWKSQHKS